MRGAPKNVAPIRPGQSTGSDGGSGDYGERLARIETKLEHMATREEIEAKMNKIFLWFISLLSGVITILGGATALLVVTLFRFLGD